MDLEHECRKKDKRLLVLLALGFLIMFFDIGISSNYKPAVHDYSWFEIREAENSLYRFELTDDPADKVAKQLFAGKKNILVQVNKPMFNRGKQGRALSLQKDQNGKYKAHTSVSPRLSFFLGQPLPINIADVEDLTLVPGIGPSLADNIIAYRKDHGCVNDPYQLEDISGIGPRMKMRLQNYFTYSVDGE